MDTLRIDDKGGYCWRKRILRGRALRDSRASSARQDRCRHIAAARWQARGGRACEAGGRARYRRTAIQRVDSRESLGSGAEFFFLALPHGLAAEFAAPLIEAGKKVVDLSADFRLHDAALFREFYGHEHGAPHLLAEAVFGIPEIHREEIARASLVASAGCYPTSILLPLVPLLKAGLIKASTIIANSVSGVSGAGRKAETSLLFAECHESLRAYGIPKYRHLSEIEQELSWAANDQVTITFVPSSGSHESGHTHDGFRRPGGGC